VTVPNEANPLVYVSSDRHGLLGSGALSPNGPTIGDHGCRLTLGILSMNRSALTVKLLQSLLKHEPSFRGEVLVLDNGSERHHLERLRDYLRGTPFCWRVIDAKENHGVAGGRNRLADACATEWLSFLDNDLYLRAPFLNQAQRALATLGCHFLNFPLLDADGKRYFAFGGHLYVHPSEGGIHVGGGSAMHVELSQTVAPFLSTFLFGGASIVKLSSFRRLGGFDANALVGFEDIDFSIRLFEEGMKVGNVPVAAFVHDHPPPIDEADHRYERGRFSSPVIERSAKYFEQKLGFVFWNEHVERWLGERHLALGIDGESQLKPQVKVAAARVGMRPRVVLMIDRYGWAFHNIAKQLKTHLNDRFEIEIISSSDLGDLGLALLASRGADLVHFFWRGDLSILRTPYMRNWAKQRGFENIEALLKDWFADTVLTSCVYDHLLLEPRELSTTQWVLNDPIAAYYTSSRRLQEIYQRLPGVPAPAGCIPDGVDTSIFWPRPGPRRPGPWRIGFTGNSAWASDQGDIKGVRTVLRPAIERLADYGLSAVPYFLDRAAGDWRPHADMPAYYRELDVYACVSSIEGTPNPVLEAMASGVPIVSTDVGIVPELFGPRQRALMLQERSIDACASALAQLLQDASLRAEVSRENCEQIRNHDWRQRIPLFERFFSDALAKHTRPRGALALHLYQEGASFGSNVLRP
jgi:glycosyltransferase involved in cell wall biosynthesis/GT2 family glycosyltransferase